MGNGGVIRIVVLSLVFLGLTPRAAPAQAFVNIGSIKGESTDKSHAGWINVISYNFKGGPPDTGGQVGHGELVIVKQVDTSSPALKQTCASGRSMPVVTFDVLRKDGKPGFIKYTFQNAVIRSVTPSGSGGTESISLNYGSVAWTYTQYKETGGSKAKLPGTWSPGKSAGP
jgi:type VI secretion system secreted protein Hcp